MFVFAVLSFLFVSGGLFAEEKSECIRLLREQSVSLLERGLICGRANRCTEDVVQLLQQLPNPDEATVLIVYPKDLSQHLFPQKVRFAVEQWRFHAVISVGEKILDVHHGKEKPSFVSTDVYFDSMFGRNNVSFKKLEVKIVPARYYLSIFEKRSLGFHFWLLNAERDGFETPSLYKFILSEVPDSKLPDLQVARKPNPSFTSRVSVLRENNQFNFRAIGLHRNVSFRYQTLSPERTPIDLSISGRLIRVGKKSVQIKMGNTKEEIPYELIYQNSIYATSD